MEQAYGEGKKRWRENGREGRIKGGVRDVCFSQNSRPDFFPDREAQLLAVAV